MRQKTNSAPPFLAETWGILLITALGMGILLPLMLKSVDNWDRQVLDISRNLKTEFNVAASAALKNETAPLETTHFNLKRTPDGRCILGDEKSFLPLFSRPLKVCVTPNPQ
jgi:hypothetical protein